MADSSFTGTTSPSHPGQVQLPLDNFDFTFSHAHPQPPSSAAHLPFHTHRDPSSTSEFSSPNSGPTSFTHRLRPVFGSQHGTAHATSSITSPDSRPSSPLRRSPSPVDQSLPSARSGDVLPPIFVDHTAKLFVLSASNSDILRGFVKLGSVAPALSQTDLATRLYILAAVLSSSQSGTRTTTPGTTRAVTVDDITSIMADLKIQLEDSFRLTKEQIENSRAIAQDLIYEPTRTNYKSLWTDVQQRLAKDHAVLRMSNVFGNPHREKVLVTLIKRQTSSVRNAFRQDIRDSVQGNGKGTRSLVDFTWQMAVKYRGTRASDLDISYTIKNALVRRFAIDNPELLNIHESEHSTDSDLELTHVDPDSGPAQKKRKQSGRGRIANGECFWSRFEGYITPLIERMGANMASPAWKMFSEDIIARDRSLFPHAGDRLHTIPPPSTEPFVGSFQPISMPPSTTPLPAPHVPPPSYSAPSSAPSSAGTSQATTSYDLARLLKY